AQDRLEEQITSLGAGADAFLTIEDSVAAAVSMVSGLASVNAPSGERITGSYEQLTKKASQLRNEVGDCEHGHLNADFGTISDLLSNLLQIINGQRGKNHVTITSYQVGSIAQLPAFQKIKEASAKQNADLNGSTKDLEDVIKRYEQKQQERNLADEKTKAGKGQILNGLLIAGAAIAGTAAIIVTFGAATPVVVGAFTIGVTSGLYGMSTANEGINNVILGTSGDGTTIGMNPIRDTIFASNPGLYYTIGDISTMVCVLAVPIGGATASAMTAGTSVLRAVAVEGGKTVLASVGGAATSELVYKKTNNEVLSMISGVAVGALAYGGMTKFDSVKNISGYHTNPVVENVAANAEVLKNGENYNSFRDLMSPEELAKYEKYWDNVSKGKYDIPYEMTDVEYYQYLKGLSKVDSAIKGGYKTISEQMLETSSAKLWGTLDEGTNQGIKHFSDYWDKYPERIPSLAQRLGISAEDFSNTVSGFEKFTEQANKVIKKGIKREVNGKSIYYVEGVANPKKGVVVIVKDGKIQSMMPSDLKSFNKLQ
ncbi:MAG: hypothetical protein ACERKZ_20300, partial [Lachnotalea sp.]